MNPQRYLLTQLDELYHLPAETARPHHRTPYIREPYVSRTTHEGPGQASRTELLCT